jgi:2-dehydro-3-deoxyphosphogluconate aldolase / (4S)-4-hydroxy-2-oxoglutarate aldolase
MGDALVRLGQARLVAVLRVSEPELVEPAVDALVAGGLTAVELTFTTPGVAAELDAARRRYPDILLGAGTIRSPGEAAAAADAGADFLVMPHFDRDLLGACLATGLPSMPGVFTASELGAALGAGAEIVKLFPASTAGPAHMRALFGPFPGVPVVPTGGIGLEDVAAWLDAGALAVGVGGELCSTRLIDAGHFDELAQRARDFRAVAA